jgi:hypothetical protein
VTVSASAPFGLESVSWAGRNTGIAGIDAPHARELAGEPVDSATWSGLAIDTPGTYTFGAGARGRRSARAPDGYPHEAGEHAPEPAVVLTVVERADALSR